MYHLVHYVPNAIPDVEKSIKPETVIIERVNDRQVNKERLEQSEMSNEGSNGTEVMFRTTNVQLRPRYH